MDKVKKIFAASGGVLIIACWPLVVGQIGQKVVEDNISNFGNQSFHIDLIKYDRGYLSSDAQFKVSIANPDIKLWLKHENLPSEYRFNSHFTHGFVSFNGVTTSKQKNVLSAVIDSKTQLNGNTEINTTMGGYTYQERGKNWNYNIAPSTMMSNITVLGEVTYQLTVPSFQMYFPNGDHLDLTSVHFSGKGKQLQHFWVGHNRVRVEDIVFSKSGQPNVIQSHNVSYTVSSNIDADMQHMTSHHDLKIDDITNALGTINNSELDIEIGNLNAPILDDIAQLSHSLTQGRNDVASIRSQMMKKIDQLVTKGLYLDIKTLGFSYKNAQMSNQLKLSLTPIQSDKPLDSAVLLQAIEGHYHSVVDKALANKFPNLQVALDDLVSMGMASDSDKSYELKGKIKDGNIVFPNGKTLPVAKLLLPLLTK